MKKEIKVKRIISKIFLLERELDALETEIALDKEIKHVEETVSSMPDEQYMEAAQPVLNRGALLNDS